MIEIRKNCKYRHDNGNCLKIGGFCLAVSDELCERIKEISGMNDEPCRECKYGNCYNANWCECYHPMIKGSRVQIKCGCVVELIKDSDKAGEQE